MSVVSDPIADMLARIRNAQKAEHTELALPASKIKLAIAEVLKNNGYIEDVQRHEDEQGHSTIVLKLKYYQGAPVIEDMTRVSRPSRRIYVHSKNIPSVLNGLGISIMSTSRGIMDGAAAKKQNLGGEMLCYVW
jgi:small subunit ribosomal protein S8